MPSRVLPRSPSAGCPRTMPRSKTRSPPPLPATRCRSPRGPTPRTSSLTSPSRSAERARSDRHPVRLSLGGSPCVVFIKGAQGSPLSCVRVENLTVDGRKGTAEAVLYGIYCGDAIFPELSGQYYCDPGHCDAASVPWYLAVSRVQVSDVKIQNASKYGLFFHKSTSIEVSRCAVSDNCTVGAGSHSGIMTWACRDVSVTTAPSPMATR